MLFLGFGNDQFIHDFTNGGMNGSQYQISGGSHIGAFGIRHS